MADSGNELAWGARYETGIPTIDCQHQSLFKALRYLYEAIYEGQVHAEVGVVLEFLDKYVKIHFAEEETYMKRIGYPEVAAHAAEHQAFKIQVYDLRSRYLTNELEVSLQTSMLLFAWFRDHILIQDMAFAEHAKLQNAAVK